MDILVTIKAEDEIAIRELYEQSFSDSIDFVNYYFKEKFIPERVMAIKADGRIASMLHLNPFDVNFNQKEYSVSYIVAVATAVEYRNKGYMGRLMKEALIRLYNEGEVFSLLMPIDSRIYERYGFGFIEDHLKLECDSSTFTIEKIECQSRLAELKDVPELVNIYQVFSEKFNLATIRNGSSFEKLFKELQTDKGHIVMFEDGYMMTYYEDEVLHIREFVSNTQQALNEMISYIKEETTNGKVVIMDHMKSPIKYITPNILENIIILKPFMMARIINVETFLKANCFMFINDIRMKITDSLIEANNFVFHINNGEVTKEDTSDFDIELDIKLLTQLSFGYRKATEIYGLIESIKNVFKDINIFKDITSNNFFNEYV
jgi:predicted acetyltransferase